MEIAGNPQAPVFAIAAEFDSARDLYRAAEKVRDAGYTRWDVYSPFPIHGMDRAMGLKRSYLAQIVFLGGLAGFLSAVALEFFPSSYLYPLVVAGKPTNLMTVPAFFPIMFELTILCSAFTALFGMLILNGLPRWNHPLFNWERFRKVTEDEFYVAIEARDSKFSDRATREFLESIGGRNVTIVHDE